MNISVNIWAVLMAAVSAFLIGGAWYSPAIFGNVWMKAAELDEEELRETNMGRIFGLAFFFLLIMAFCLAMFLADPSLDLAGGAFYGFLAGFGWIFTALAVNSLYERRSWTYIFINGGYWVLVFTVMGLIIGAW